jgi:hypothetical protein
MHSPGVLHLVTASKRATSKVIVTPGQARTAYQTPTTTCEDALTPLTSLLEQHFFSASSAITVATLFTNSFWPTLVTC